MTAWILFVVLNSGSGFTQEFNSLSACNRGVATVQSIAPGSKTVCITKG